MIVDSLLTKCQPSSNHSLPSHTFRNLCDLCDLVVDEPLAGAHYAHLRTDAISIPTCNKPRLRGTRAKQATIFAAPTRSIFLLFLASAGENLRDRFICETYQKHVRERSWHFGGMTGPGKIASDAR